MCAETDGAGAEVQEESGGHELRQHSLYRDPKVSNACNESSLLSMHRRKAIQLIQLAVQSCIFTKEPVTGSISS